MFPLLPSDILIMLNFKLKICLKIGLHVAIYLELPVDFWMLVLYFSMSDCLYSMGSGFD